MSVVEATGLGRRYGKAWALRGCSLRVEPGVVVGLIGPNGAGKSTLLNIVAGLIEPSEGTLRLFGGSDMAQARTRIGFAAQGHPLYRGFTVADMVRAGRRLNRTWDEADAIARLSHLDIPLGRRIGRLSGGQQAQVSLALALAKRPALLVLDEPVAALDPIARRDFMGVLMGVVAERGADRHPEHPRGVRTGPCVRPSWWRSTEGWYNWRARSMTSSRGTPS